jgi:hypothetical protein
MAIKIKLLEPVYSSGEKQPLRAKSNGIAMESV